MLSALRPTVSLATIIALVATLTLATGSVVVSRGDTLSGIAAAHQVSVAQLVSWNGIADPDLIVAGSTIVLADPGETATTTTQPSSSTYRITPGDTLWLIATRFGLVVARLAQLNSIANPDLIIAGRDLRLDSGPAAPIPSAPTDTSTAGPPRTHTVVPGDTLSGIAVSFGLRAGVLADANSISDPDRIGVGDELVIPGFTTTPPTTMPPTTTTTPPTTTTTPPTTTATPPTTTATPLPPTTATTPAATVPDPSAIGATSLTPLFGKWSAVYSVPRGLLEALAWKESNWRPDAIGPAGHLGVAQISPGTIEFIESNLLGVRTDPLDPSDGIRLEARYLRYLIDRTPTERYALAAWNQGLQGVLTNGISQSAGRFADDVIAIRNARS